MDIVTVATSSGGLSTPKFSMLIQAEYFKVDKCLFWRSLNTKVFNAHPSSSTYLEFDKCINESLHNWYQVSVPLLEVSENYYPACACMCETGLSNLFVRLSSSQSSEKKSLEDRVKQLLILSITPQKNLCLCT